MSQWVLITYNLCVNKKCIGIITLPLRKDIIRNKISDVYYSIDDIDVKGKGKSYSILDIARLILSKTNSDANMIYLPLPEDDPLKRKPSVKLAKNLLNWEPKTDINKGLNKTVDYIKKHLV